MRAATRIAVDLVYFTGRKGGTETYARELFPVLAAAAPELQLIGITNTEVGGTAPEWFPGPVRRLPVSGENRLTWAAAEAALVGLTASRMRADLLHCPANFGPVVRTLPTVVTVHDLLPLKHPDWVPGLRGRAVGALARAAARAASRVITDSRASADDLQQLVGLGPDQVDVVPLASSTVSTRARTASGPPQRPFVLSTGNRLPHKNFEGLLHAWARIPAERRPLLVITGSHGDDPLARTAAELGLSDDVQLERWVPTDELERLYRDALAYVCPSLFEGFGLPVLEAMVRGCPVISSDLPVLREVAGDAARYVDMRRADDVARVVLDVAEDPGQRRALSAAGHERAARFSWQRTAELTLATYDRVLSGTARVRL